MPYHINTVGPGKFEVVDDQGKVAGTHPTRKRAIAQLQALYANVPEAKNTLKSASEAEDMDATDKATAEINNLPDSAFLYVESGGDKDEDGRTVPRSLRHLPYKTQDGGIDLPKLRNALSRLGQPATGTTGGEKWLTENVRKSLISKAQKILADNTDAASAQPESKEAPEPEVKQSILDRVITSLTGWKEGRRNSTPDGDRLQQIHDLAVLNGASCPMVMKEASGELRWVLLSSNAFIDSDKEIISTKALEDDVARTDKAAAPYGPLRWWHMGAPDPIALSAGSGADIGDCDYRAMSGRVLIESGTFRNERIGEAIKERADTLAGSIGFFHPKDEPDSEGVYRNIVQFERSLLPRGKASNMLTALTVKGWEDMATSKEKQDALAALLGDPSLAKSVIEQAEIVEKQADDKGMKYKEQEATEKAVTGTPTAVPATGASGINPIGMESNGKKAKKAEGEPPNGEGRPGEEAAEPKAEAAAEPDWEAYAEKMKPHLMKMIEEKMKAGAKETAEKEAGLNAKIAALETSIKELTGDVPRGLQGFRAALSPETILKEFNSNSAATQPGSLDDVIDRLAGIKK